MPVTGALKSKFQSYDVIVCGGGLAGIAAAISSARAGASTLLIEKEGWLGGMGITGATGLHSFFNVFDACPGTERTRVAGGIAQELVDRVTAQQGGMGHIRMERGGDFVSMLTPVEPEVFKFVAAEMCLQAGVRLLLHTIVEDVQTVSRHIESITVWNKAGRNTLRARQWIDCTGDGDLAAYAGAACKNFDANDPGAYSSGFTFRLVNVDLAALEADLDRRGLISQLAHAVKPGDTQPSLVRLGIDMNRARAEGIENAPGYFLSSSLRPRELTYCNCINYGPNNGLDADALTRAEVYLRAKMLDVSAMFRKHFDGCHDAYPAGPSPIVGQRRGRAVRCDYELT